MTLLILLLALAPVESPETRFAEGNAHFDAGAYEEARAIYHEILADGHASAGLYFNLANTYYRLDSLGRAVQYLEKARALTPDDPRVAHNLSVVRARLGIDTRPAPLPYWESGLSWMHRNVSPALLFAAGFLLFLAALGIAGWRVWTGQRTPWVRRGLLVFLPPALLLMGGAFVLSLGVGPGAQGVILQNVALGAPQPGEGAEMLEGQMVRLLDWKDGQVEVEIAGGARGWVQAADVGQI